MQECIERWKNEVEKRGMLEAREDDRDWMSMEGGGAILQLRRRDTYIRVSWNADAPQAFKFSRYVSTEYPLYPKTDFHMKPYEPSVLTMQEVERELFGA